MIETLQFNDALHEYSDSLGKVPGVTSIIRECLKDNEEIPQYMAWYLERGKRVHEACEMYLKAMVQPDGRLVCFERPQVEEWLESLSPDYKGYVLGFHKFLVRWTTNQEVTLLGTEIRTFEPAARFGGTIDMKVRLVIKNENGSFEEKWLVIDFKCGQPEKWHILQVGAYSVAESTADQLFTGALLYLNKEGKPAWLKPVGVQANIDWRQMMAWYNLKQKYN